MSNNHFSRGNKTAMRSQKQHSIIRTGYVVSCFTAFMVSALWSQVVLTQNPEPKNYLIDTLVVVDDVMFSRFQQWVIDSSAAQGVSSSLNVTSKLEEYVSLVFHQTNDRLATLRLPFKISLQVSAIQINKSIINASEKEQTPEQALNLFRTWIQTNQLGDKYDFALLLTGHPLGSEPLSSGGSNFRGRASVGKMCDTLGFSSAVVQDYGGFQSVLFVAHEVAHILGVGEHDGMNQSCPQDRYIMSANIEPQGTDSNKNHPWYFSNCSTTAINSYVSWVTASTSNCLSSNLEPIPQFSATLNSISGQLYKADDQCKMINGKKSRLCLGGVFSSLDGICTSMDCMDPTFLGNGVKCDSYFAAEGTSCGDGKWCKLGRCVSSDNAPAMDLRICPNGDSVSLVDGLECSVAIKNRSILCYEKMIHDLCCASCEKIRKISTICPFGDRIEGCTKASCVLNNQDCCGMCSDVDSIDGVTCNERVTMNRVQGCYNITVANSCSQTCSKFRSDLPGCGFGDHLLDGTCRNCTSSGSQCCESCRSAGSALGWTSIPMSVFVLLLISGNISIMLI